MNEIDPITGLPKDLFGIEKIQDENTKIKVYSKKASYNKDLTIIEGVPKDNIETIAKTLKKRLSCGGTIKDGYIGLQGNHKEKVKKILIDLGFDEKKIDII